MSKEIITVEDLIKFKHELLSEIKEILGDKHGNSFPKYLKTSDIKKILGLSSSSIQTLRNKGILPFTKIRGTIYYELKDIEKLFAARNLTGRIATNP
jgi:hypothetical protein